MKLLFIFTGGTIGSTFDGEYISTDRNKPKKIIELYREKFGIDFELEVLEPYTALSENNDGETLKILTKCVTEKIKENFHGIIVTHGTDTLQYSAAALSYCVGLNSIPVCLVSSNLPLEKEDANGLVNLHAAVRFITEKEGKGVVVPYKNPGQDVKIFRASRLLSSQAYSDFVFDCQGEMGHFDENWNYVKNPRYREKADGIDPLNCNNFGGVCDGVLRIEPYPGRTYPHISEGIKCIIHGSFHSGTINTVSSEALRFFKMAQEKNIPVFLTGIEHRETYESTEIFKDFEIIPVFGIAPISAFIKLWMALSLNHNPTEIMAESLGGDVIDRV